MSAPTLDGMSVEQLRDLAKRAENAAQSQEAAQKEAAKPKVVPLNADGHRGWSLRLSDGAFLTSDGCTYYEEASKVLLGLGNRADLETVAALFTAALKHKPRDCRERGLIS